MIGEYNWLNQAMDRPDVNLNDQTGTAGRKIIYLWNENK